MADYGFKISKAGYSKDSPAHKQIVHSGYETVKIKSSGTGTLVKAAGNNTVTHTITHNLGYVPLVYVYGKYINDAGATVNRYREFLWQDTFALNFWEIYKYEVTTTTLTITYTTTFFFASVVSLDYFYIISSDRAT